MVLRPYQRQALASTLQDYNAYQRRLLGVVPTGGGKTAIASRIPELLKQGPGQQGWFIVNRDDLAWQAAAAFQNHFKEAGLPYRVGIEKAEEHCDAGATDVIIASIQSIGKKSGVAERLRRFSVDRAMWGILDEAHESLSGAYKNVLTHLRMNKAGENNDPGKLLIGITATPSRMDNRGLEELFDKISFHVSLEELMSTGVRNPDGTLYTYLAQPKCYRVSTNCDLSKARKYKGDFAEADVSAALDTDEFNHMVASKYLEFGEGMPAIGFAVNVSHCYRICDVFRSRGITSAVVIGETSRKDRVAIYEAYDRGDIDVLWSVDALSTGFDKPKASVCLNANPTMSATRFQQRVGRVFRRFPAPERLQSDDLYDGWVKPYSIIIDFVHSLGTHSLVTAPTLFGLNANFDAKGRNLKQAADEVKETLLKFPTLAGVTSIEELHAQTDMIDVFNAPKVRTDVSRLSSFNWVEIFPGVLSLKTKGFDLEIKEDALGQHHLYAADKGSVWKLPCGTSLADALKAGDAQVPKDQHVILKTKAGWRRDEPTEAQCRHLYRQDPRFERAFPNGWRDFYKHAVDQHDRGNNNFSKGGISQMINQVLLIMGKGSSQSPQVESRAH